MNRARLFRRVTLAAAAIALLIGAAPEPPKAALRDPDRLVILSTTDVKGKTSPCGCHTPKGGLARRASFVDSIRVEHGQVMLVDAGGYFPETDPQQPAGPYMLEEMARLGTDVVGVGDRDLRFGLATLRDAARAAKLPVVCANLTERATKRPAFAATYLKKVGSVKVGVFGLITDKSDLGPSRDALVAGEPTAAATRAVAELKKQGATVIVLLSQLGKVESEDLVTAVEGIDVVIVGRNVPLLEKGRMIGSTVAAYGGEQGWYLGRTLVNLDPQRRVTSAENDMFMLGPDVLSEPTVLGRVKGFEDRLNEQLRLQEKQKAVQESVGQRDEGTESPEHYVGAEVCGRCHTSEHAQWLTTAHARAWQTLVDQKKDATPECVKCHVVGFQQPGGFHTSADAAKLGNVQCENCHGMGTQHDGFSNKPQAVTEATCRQCHDATSSPTFDFALYAPHIQHKPVAGLQPLPESPAKKLMKAGAHGSH